MDNVIDINEILYFIVFDDIEEYYKTNKPSHEYIHRIKQWRKISRVINPNRLMKKSL